MSSETDQRRNQPSNKVKDQLLAKQKMVLVVSEMSKRVNTPVEEGYMMKKCRICFQSEKVPMIQKEDVTSSPIRGKEPVSMWDYFSHLLKINDAFQDDFEEGDGFVAPCKCSGSMAWVHRRCLRIWRNKSPRRDSFYQCEQCFTPYKFKHTTLTKLLSNQVTVWTLTVLMLATSALLSLHVVSHFPPNQDVYTMFGTSRTWSIEHTRAYKTTVSDGGWSSSCDDAANTRKNSRPKRENERRHIGHSPVSYFNIGFWMTGHSYDEKEDLRNDFLSAILDQNVAELILVMLGLLGCLALIREGTQASAMLACFLGTSTIGMVYWRCFTFIWIYPVPMSYGMVRYVQYVQEFVEGFVDFTVKLISSDLENQQ